MGRGGCRGATETPAPCRHGGRPSPGWGRRGLCPAEQRKTGGALSECPASPISESLRHPLGRGLGQEARWQSLPDHLLQVVEEEEEEGYGAQSHIVNIYLLLSGMGENGGYEVVSVKMQRKKNESLILLRGCRD